MMAAITFAKKILSTRSQKYALQVIKRSDK